MLFTLTSLVSCLPMLQAPVAGGSRYALGDCDGDGLLDVYAVSAGGSDQLFRNLGDGSFVDVTDSAGLGEVRGSRAALWEDFDADGWMDLYVSAVAGPGRLLQNAGGGVFLDVTASAGLDLGAPGEIDAAWLDYDADGKVDLYVASVAGDRFYHNLGRGRFEAVVLAPVEEVLGVAGATPGLDPRPGAAGESTSGPRPHGARDRTGLLREAGRAAPALTTPSASGSTSPFLAAATPCATTLRDAAGGGCTLEASSTPTLGMLHPLSTDLNVSPSGNVGVGTTTPAARLEVAGTARITDTLTLAPAGDAALDVSTGSIYKGGALFIHTKGGTNNTALGREALAAAGIGYKNTAFGAEVLQSNTTGNRNTATGFQALLANTSGSDNTANGVLALQSNTSGLRNTAVGQSSLRFNTTGDTNVAVGFGSLVFNTDGDDNTAVGAESLLNNSTGRFNTASGRRALYLNTTGTSNTASGMQALMMNTTGNSNTAVGRIALYSNTTGAGNVGLGIKALFRNTAGLRNTACGYDSLYNNTTGSGNTALGSLAGQNWTTGSDNIAIGNQGVAGEGSTIRVGTAGTQTRAFVAGIRGVTTGVADAIPVLVDSAGQLGTVSSSRRFKEEIQDMGDATERLLALRPVTFRYRPEVQSGERPLEYGLIAEEVAEVFPELVVDDEEGRPFTVKYHLLSAMLLNELEKLHARVEALEGRLEALEGAAVHTSSPDDTPR